MLLTDVAKEMFCSTAQMEANEINGQIDKVVIQHESFKVAYRGVMECITESRCSREPVNCMLLGDGGTGKTTIASVIEKSFQREVVREGDLEINTVPILNTSFKSMRSVDALVTDVLHKLGDPHPRSGKTPDKGERAVALMKACRTLIIIIDELHDLQGFEEGDLDTMRPFLKWIKAVTNSGGPAVCLAGVEACKTIFHNETSLEMSRRFKRQFILRALSLGTASKPGTLPTFLRNVCDGILKKTCLKSFPPLERYEYALKVWASTSGNTEFIMTMIKLAAKHAILAKRLEVTIDDFAEAWETGFFHQVTTIKTNPFKATAAAITNEMRKKCL